VTARLAIALGGVGAAAGFIFVGLFLGGNPRVFDFEWLGLVPLIAGLGGAILWRHSHGRLSRSRLIAGLSVLALWTAAAIMSYGSLVPKY
jgi:hypothetical protein